MFLVFGGLGGYLRYVSTPESQTILDQSPATLQGTLGTFLRPFLPFGLLLVWSNHVARYKARGRFWIASGVLLLGLLLATASYNRASMVGPVFAVLAAYSLTVRRLSERTVVIAGLGILLAGIAFGAYRAANLYGPDTPLGERRSGPEEASEFLQVYGEGPQFLGFLLQQTEGERLHLGSTLFASLLYPVPLVGKAFRESSGVHFYNRLIYGRPGIVDQVIPASGELLLNFHVIGVALFFALLGFVVQRIELRFRSASTAFAAAAFFYLGMWIACPIASSLAVLSQLVVYGFWPLYAYFGLHAVLRACRVEPAAPLPHLGVRAS
jgi:hypothetical protein